MVGIKCDGGREKVLIVYSLLSSLAHNCHPLALTEPASAKDMAIRLAHSYGHAGLFVWLCGYPMHPATVLSLKHCKNLSIQWPPASPGGAVKQAGAVSVRPPLTLWLAGQMFFFLKLQLAFTFLFPVWVGYINHAKSRQIPATHHLK